MIPHSRLNFPHLSTNQIVENLKPKNLYVYPPQAVRNLPTSKLRIQNNGSRYPAPRPVSALCALLSPLSASFARFPPRRRLTRRFGPGFPHRGLFGGLWAVSFPFLRCLRRFGLFFPACAPLCRFFPLRPRSRLTAPIAPVCALFRPVLRCFPAPRRKRPLPCRERPLLLVLSCAFSHKRRSGFGLARMATYQP